MCSRCRTQIQGGSTFCPMCGRKVPGLDSFDTLRQELPSSLGEAAAQAAANHQLFAVPRPVGDDPSLFTPLPDFGPEPSVIVADQTQMDTSSSPVSALAPASPPRTTLVLAPSSAPLLAAPAAPTMALGTYPDAPPVPAPPLHGYGLPAPPSAYGPPPPPSAYGWGQPHGHYAPRAPISGRFRAAAPVRIPITPSPARIVFGVVVASIALWLAVWFLPSYRDRLSDEVRTALGLGAGGLGLVAFGLLLTGVLYRAQAEVRCRVCARPVIAWKGAFGLHCPLGPHHARIAWATVVLVAGFWTGVVAVGIGLLVWLQ